MNVRRVLYSEPAVCWLGPASDARRRLQRAIRRLEQAERATRANIVVPWRKDVLGLALAHIEAARALVKAAIERQTQ